MPILFKMPSVRYPVNPLDKAAKNKNARQKSQCKSHFARWPQDALAKGQVSRADQMLLISVGIAHSLIMSHNIYLNLLCSWRPPSFTPITFPHVSCPLACLTSCLDSLSPFFSLSDTRGEAGTQSPSRDGGLSLQISVQPDNISWHETHSSLVLDVPTLNVRLP